MSSIKLFGNTNRQRPAARQDTGSIETVPEREAEEGGTGWVCSWSTPYPRLTHMVNANAVVLEEIE